MIAKSSVLTVKLFGGNLQEERKIMSPSQLSFRYNTPQKTYAKTKEGLEAAIQDLNAMQFWGDQRAAALQWKLICTLAGELGVTVHCGDKSTEGQVAAPTTPEARLQAAITEAVKFQIAHGIFRGNPVDPTKLKEWKRLRDAAVSIALLQVQIGGKPMTGAQFETEYTRILNEFHSRTTEVERRS